MSAFDIAGAVVATPIALVLWACLFSEKLQDDTYAGGFPSCLIFSLWAVFCISRLYGAHL